MGKASNGKKDYIHTVTYSSYVNILKKKKYEWGNTSTIHLLQESLQFIRKAPIKVGNENQVKPTVKSTQENICLIHSFYPEMCETKCFIVIAYQSFW